MHNASTTKYLYAVDLIDVLVDDHFNLALVEIAILRLVFRPPEDLVLGLHPHLRMPMELGRLVILLQLVGGQPVPRHMKPQMLLHPRARCIPHL